MKNTYTKNNLLALLIIFFTTLNAARAQSVGGTVTGATTVCPNSPNSGFLGLTGYAGNNFSWQSSTDGGVTWNNTGTISLSQSYVNLNQTTCYRVIVKDGTFPPDTSTTACISIYTPSVGGVINGGGIFCVGAASGTLNLTGNTGNVVNWQYSTNNGATWTTVANTNTTLNYPPVTQHTIYHAIVQSGPGCPTDTSSQATFVINPVTVPGIVSGSDSVCYIVNNDSLTLSGNVGTILDWLSSTDNGVSWTSTGNTSATKYYSGLTQTTWYAVVVKSGICPVDTSSIGIITIVMPPLVNAGADVTIVQGQSTELSGSGNGTPLWFPSVSLNNDIIFTPIATPIITTDYILLVKDTHGCKNKDTVTVFVAPPFLGAISNLFTPNKDGINDNWYIQDIQNLPDNEVSVYNIYGNKVYEKKNYINDWDGTYSGSNLPDGTYYYIISVTNHEGTQTFKGSVDILRNK